MFCPGHTHILSSLSPSAGLPAPGPCLTAQDGPGQGLWDPAFAASGLREVSGSAGSGEGVWEETDVPDEILPSPGLRSPATVFVEFKLKGLEQGLVDFF